MRSGLSSDIEVNPPNDIKTNPPFSGVELGFWRQATACHVARPESLLKFLCNSYTVCNTDYFDSFKNIRTFEGNVNGFDIAWKTV